MTAQSADQVAQQWASRLGASTDKMSQGADALTVAPGTLAARQKAVWAQNVAASVNTWANNVQVPLESWRADYKNKGLPRVGQGAQAAIPKMTSFFAKLLPAIATARGTLPPRGDYNANKQRANAWMDKMHALKGQLKG